MAILFSLRFFWVICDREVHGFRSAYERLVKGGGKDIHLMNGEETNKKEEK